MFYRIFRKSYNPLNIKPKPIKKGQKYNISLKIMQKVKFVIHRKEIKRFRRLYFKN